MKDPLSCLTFSSQKKQMGVPKNQQVTHFNTAGLISHCFPFCLFLDKTH